MLLLFLLLMGGLQGRWIMASFRLPFIFSQDAHVLLLEPWLENEKKAVHLKYHFPTFLLDNGLAYISLVYVVYAGIRVNKLECPTKQIQLFEVELKVQKWVSIIPTLVTLAEVSTSVSWHICTSHMLGRKRERGRG